MMFRYPEAVRRILEALAGEGRGMMVGDRKFWVQPSQREFDLSGMLKDIERQGRAGRVCSSRMPRISLSCDGDYLTRGSNFACVPKKDRWDFKESITP